MTRIDWIIVYVSLTVFAVSAFLIWHRRTR